MSRDSSIRHLEMDDSEVFTSADNFEEMLGLQSTPHDQVTSDIERLNATDRIRTQQINEMQNSLKLMQTMIQQLLQNQQNQQNQSNQAQQQAPQNTQPPAHNFTVPQTVPVPAILPVNQSKFKLENPKKFSGRNAETQTFIEAVDDKFLGESDRYDTDERQLLAVKSWTEGPAYKFIREEVKSASNQNITLTWKELRTRLLQVFTPPDEEKAARHKLATLRQTGSCATYVSEFIQIQYTSKHSNEYLMDRFEAGLKEEVLKAIVPFKSTMKSLEEYQNRAIEIDNSLFYARQAQRQFGKKPDYYFTRDKYSQREQRIQREQREPSVSRTLVANNGPTPMDLDSNKIMTTKLTSEVRNQLKKEGKCFYCRQTGHLLGDCPARKNRKSIPSQGNGNRQ